MRIVHQSQIPKKREEEVRETDQSSKSSVMPKALREDEGVKSSANTGDFRHLLWGSEIYTIDTVLSLPLEDTTRYIKYTTVGSRRTEGTTGAKDRRGAGGIRRTVGTKELAEQEERGEQ
ncbi:hypothetical protein PoB_004761300 [Plakobranchus ocellatus]|uniref:Uncharacterized protein n=1 Tax=Plakobranchus ocellatus TaxID=259542 RepID=A0AAV4BPS1_9GAST|nr:hypothetical protein PoB_004761300 [Plakobranchus ocellatus]